MFREKRMFFNDLKLHAHKKKKADDSQCIHHDSYALVDDHST